MPRSDAMQRRKFITLLGGAAAVWPLASRAQQPALSVVGFLSPGSPEPVAHLVVAFRKGLSDVGYVEGRNVAIEFRWTGVEHSGLQELAADLVRRRVDVIAAPSSAPAALAAKAATTIIPIVFGTQTDPVQAGLVPSLNRPGGNVTGVSGMGIEICGKQFELLHDLLPAAGRFAVLVNPSVPVLADPIIKQVQTASVAIGAQVETLSATTDREIDAAFASLVQKRADALIVGPSLLFENRRAQITTLATRHAVPTMYWQRGFVEAGGLMSYGPNFADQYRQVGIYTGRVLKGEKPADLPVMQATKLEFVINLRTTRTLGIEVPPDLLAIADEVIE